MTGNNNAALNATPVLSELASVFIGALVVGAMVFTLFGLSGLPLGEPHFDATAASPAGARHARVTVINRRSGWLDMLRFDSVSDQS